MRWDFHKHKSYTDCPRKYKFEADRVEPPKKDNRYYAVRGSVMQKFFELYSNGHYPSHLELTFEPVRRYLKPFYDRELSYNHVDWKDIMSKRSRDGLLDEISEVIEQNLLKLDIYSTGMRSEMKYTVTLKNGDELVGKVDFEKTYPDGTVALLDGKSTGTVGKNIELDQLLFYAWLYRVKEGKLPDKLGFIYYQMCLLDWKRFDEVDVVGAVKRILGSLEAAKTAKDFPPTPSAKACKYCSYMGLCKEGQESKESRKRGPRDAGLESLFEAGEDGFLKLPASLPKKGEGK